MSYRYGIVFDAHVMVWPENPSPLVFSSLTLTGSPEYRFYQGPSPCPQRSQPPRSCNHRTDMSSWRLPLEVCEDIIDHIPPRHILTSPVIFGIAGEPQSSRHLTYRRDLYACALTCRSWVPRARIKLFCYVLLNSPKSGQAFVRTISVSPELGRYIRCLSIGGSHPPSGFRRSSD